MMSLEVGNTSGAAVRFVESGGWLWGGVGAVWRGGAGGFGPGSRGGGVEGMCVCQSGGLHCLTRH